MVKLEMDRDQAGLVAFALRNRADEFWGALKREPDSDATDAWQEKAEWLDAKASELSDAYLKREPK